MKSAYLFDEPMSQMKVELVEDVAIVEQLIVKQLIVKQLIVEQLIVDEDELLIRI